MIKTFACRETEAIWNGLVSRKLPRDIQDRALRKLRQLDTAQRLDDLKNPPSNRLENLKGTRKGRMSLRINNQWRIVFVWENNEAYDVEIIDYH